MKGRKDLVASAAGARWGSSRDLPEALIIDAVTHGRARGQGQMPAGLLTGQDLKDVAAFANLQFCVDMFFALSGFVLCHAYGSRLNHGADGLRFLKARFARLWPLHMVMLVLFVGIEISKAVFMRADGSMPNAT